MDRYTRQLKIVLGFLISDFSLTRELNSASRMKHKLLLFVQSCYRQFQQMKEGLCWQSNNNLAGQGSYCNVNLVPFLTLLV